MSSIVQSIGDVISSIFELFGSLIQTIFNVFSGVLQGIYKLIAGTLGAVVDLLKGTIQAAGGVGKFLLSNIGVLLVIALLFFGFLQYQRSQGRQVKVGDKKLN